MKKFEYEILKGEIVTNRLQWKFGDDTYTNAGLTDVLNLLGNNGWQMTTKFNDLKYVLMREKKVEVVKEVADAIEELSELCTGFDYEMYCKMNKYLFNQAWDYRNSKLESLRTCNLFDVVDAIRYGYTIKDVL